MSKTQRKAKNLVLFPKFQVKWTLYYLVSGLSVFGAVAAFAFVKLGQVRDLINQNPEMSFAVQIKVNDAIFEVVQATLAGFVFYIIFASVFTLIMSHRIAGPVVAITAFIEQLKEGNYEYTRTLRKRDELNEVMDGLKELAVVMKQKDGNGKE